MAADIPTALTELLEPHGVLAWLATYLLHSTLLLGGAWLASRWLRGRSPAVEERLWKAALVGGLLTATIQTGLAALPAAPAAAAEAPVARVVVATSFPAPPASTAPVERLAAPSPRLGGLAAALPGWQRLALAGWLGGCLLLGGGLALGWLRLRLRLRGREDVASGPAGRLLHGLLARTATRRPVRLTGTAALPVPVALGVGEREICLPRRALRELDERRQEGLLAHELAHLERRDPAWLLGALALQSVFFFQPLNRLARRRLEEISEVRCDEWAIRATGDRLSLARCLTEVASWLVTERSALPAPGMARSRSGLGDRVRRILDGVEDEAAGSGRARWLPAAGAAGLLAAALLVPGLAPATFAEAEAAPPDAVAAEPAIPPAEAEPAPEPNRAPDPAPRPHAEPQADDLDWDFDTDHVPDPEEISRLVADAVAEARDAIPDAEAWAEMREEMQEAVREAVEAREEAMEAQNEAMEELARALELELEGLHEDRELTEAEKARVRAEIAREMERAHEEMERALGEIGPELEELQRMNLHIERDVAEGLRRAGEELERARREMRLERDEARRHVDRELRDAREQLDLERRELEEMRRQLERERRDLDLDRERDRERDREQRREEERMREGEGETSPPRR